MKSLLSNLYCSFTYSNGYRFTRHFLKTYMRPSGWQRVQWLKPGKMNPSWAGEWVENKCGHVYCLIITTPSLEPFISSAKIFQHLKNFSTHNIDQRLINWINSFRIHLSPLPCFPPLATQMEWNGRGWDRDRKWTVCHHIASFEETHSSDWAVLGTLAFPFYPGWGEPLLVKYSWDHIDFCYSVNCVIFHFDHFNNSTIWFRPAVTQKLISQELCTDIYTLPRNVQVSETSSFKRDFDLSHMCICTTNGQRKFSKS